MPHQPTIVIVGRPNVGKSTLFNRLTGRRAALVSDMPGLTRDRREGEAHFGAAAFTIVDTAGLEEGARGSIAARLRRHTETAIKSADLVLFVIDARAGVTAADQEFARAVRQAGRPTILIANKCEGRGGIDGVFESFELGLGEPVAVSSEHGEGIGALIADMLAALGVAADRDTTKEPGGDGAADDRTERPVRVAIVGRPNVGKSTLINALLGEERMLTGPEPGLTRDAIAVDLSVRGRALRLFDTAGLRRRARVTGLAEKLSAGDTLRAVRFAEVVVLLIDAGHAFEHQDLSIGDLITQEGRALVIAVNKWDLVADKQQRLRELRALAAAGLAQVPGVAVVAVSALAERGLDRLIDAVFAAYAVWNRRVATADLNRWLEEATLRHAPPAARGRRIKLRFITQPSSRPPTFVAFCSRPEALPGSYLRYLVNSLRETFELPGVPIRLTLRKGDNPYRNR